mmetsp:Transcript_5356/g.33572  ORF Transcript_5356/g.33572 Transcript_5356/m.33572 type:complete len:724 (-) Transcript_5356:552-2723(-)
MPAEQLYISLATRPTAWNLEAIPHELPSCAEAACRSMAWPWEKKTKMSILCLSLSCRQCKNLIQTRGPVWRRHARNQMWSKFWAKSMQRIRRLLHASLRLKDPSNNSKRLLFLAPSAMRAFVVPKLRRSAPHDEIVPFPTLDRKRLVTMCPSVQQSHSHLMRNRIPFQVWSLARLDFSKKQLPTLEIPTNADVERHFCIVVVVGELSVFVHLVLHDKGSVMIQAFTRRVREQHTRHGQQVLLEKRIQQSWIESQFFQQDPVMIHAVGSSLWHRRLVEVRHFFVQQFAEAFFEQRKPVDTTWTFLLHESTQFLLGFWFVVSQFVTHLAQLRMQELRLELVHCTMHGLVMLCDVFLSLLRPAVHLFPSFSFFFESLQHVFHLVVWHLRQDVGVVFHELLLGLVGVMEACLWHIVVRLQEATTVPFVGHARVPTWTGHRRTVRDRRPGRRAVLLRLPPSQCACAEPPEARGGRGEARGARLDPVLGVRSARVGTFRGRSGMEPTCATLGCGHRTFRSALEHALEEHGRMARVGRRAQRRPSADAGVRQLRPPSALHGSGQRTLCESNGGSGSCQHAWRRMGDLPRAQRCGVGRMQPQAARKIPPKSRTRADGSLPSAGGAESQAADPVRKAEGEARLLSCVPDAIQAPEHRFHCRCWWHQRESGIGSLLFHLEGGRAGCLGHVCLHGTWNSDERNRFFDTIIHVRTSCAGHGMGGRQMAHLHGVPT